MKYYKLTTTPIPHAPVHGREEVKKQGVKPNLEEERLFLILFLFLTFLLYF